MARRAERVFVLAAMPPLAVAEQAVRNQQDHPARGRRAQGGLGPHGEQSCQAGAAKPLLVGDPRQPLVRRGRQQDVQEARILPGGDEVLR
jgi:hypothetical protein